MRRFFIDPLEISKENPGITGAEANHIKNVLRLKPGEKIEVTDGKGLLCEATITALSSGRIDLDIQKGQAKATTESHVQITIAQALLKDKKMDVLLRQLTELGINRWIPFTATRSITRIKKERLSSRMKRWEKIAKEAVKQCKRSAVPEVCPPATFEDVLEMGSRSDLMLFFWEEGGKSLGAISRERESEETSSLFVILGPEGGFTRQEAEKAAQMGCATATLGPRILRAETATLAACALVQYLFGDMGKNILTKP